MLKRIILPALMTTIGCLGATAVGEDSSRDPSERRASTAQGTETNPDGGTSTVRARSATLTLDGRACRCEGVGNGLDMGLDGNGWTMALASEECGVMGTRTRGRPCDPRPRVRHQLLS